MIFQFRRKTGLVGGALRQPPYTAGADILFQSNSRMGTQSETIDLTQIGSGGATLYQAEIPDEVFNGPLPTGQRSAVSFFISGNDNRPVVSSEGLIPLNNPTETNPDRWIFDTMSFEIVLPNDGFGGTIDQTSILPIERINVGGSNFHAVGTPLSSLVPAVELMPTQSLASLMGIAGSSVARGALRRLLRMGGLPISRGDLQSPARSVFSLRITGMTTVLDDARITAGPRPARVAITVSLSRVDTGAVIATGTVTVRVRSNFTMSATNYLRLRVEDLDLTLVSGSGVASFVLNAIEGLVEKAFAAAVPSITRTLNRQIRGGVLAQLREMQNPLLPIPGGNGIFRPRLSFYRLNSVRGRLDDDNMTEFRGLLIGFTVTALTR